jgi:PKHD-type hydroxylase
VSIGYSFGLPLKNNFAEFVSYEGLFLPHEINRWLGDRAAVPVTITVLDLA